MSFNLGDKVVLVDRTIDPHFWPDIGFPLFVLGWDDNQYTVGIRNKPHGDERWVHAFPDELMPWEEYIATKTLMEGKEPSLVPEEVVEDLARSMVDTKHNIISRLLTNKRK